MDGGRDNFDPKHPALLEQSTNTQSHGARCVHGVEALVRASCRRRNTSTSLTTSTHLGMGQCSMVLLMFSDYKGMRLLIFSHFLRVEATLGNIGKQEAAYGYLTKRLADG